ncbi:MAG TPA: zinc ABC transporter substrate-binding protein [Rhizomicrobium sp.]|nr:zinc ABC transporter substrate-binding protein [Rhizomicrobium sp.]
MSIANRGVFAIALVFIAFALPAHGAVLATIRPVHALVAAVMGREPELLIQGAQSEHSYALKPSDAAKIERASLIFEIGPDLETYLVHPLATLAPHATVVALEHAPGVHLLPARHGGLWEDAGESGGPADPHIWLDPENAVAMTRAIAAALSKADPTQAKLYAANAAKEVAMLRALERELARELAPLRGRPYLVFHDGYRYFEHRFGLTPVGAVTVAPDRPIGPRRVSTLRARIARGDVACVFREPQFPPALIGTLVEGTDTRTGVLDPLGASLAPGPDLYPRLLRELSASLRACLAKTH